VSSHRLISLRGTFVRARWALGALVLALSACTFKPHIPDQAISCASDQDCPLGFACNARLARCCRPGACPDDPGPAPARTPDQDRPASNADAKGDTADGGVDQARATPPTTDAGDAHDGRPDGGPVAGLAPGRQGGCNSIPEFRKKREDAPVTPARAGLIFGSVSFAPLLPPT
jgi:hypothetical protein